jgi:ribosomal protein S18 acetylase RimI-like enzyme
VELLEIYQSRDIAPYRLLARELEFDGRFEHSMECWCGLKERAYPLAHWQVYLARVGETVVGVSGLYRRVEMPEWVGWVGWLGVRPAYRRQGIGRHLIAHLEEEARRQGMGELWVFTGESGATHFYRTLGFEVLGRGEDVAAGLTHDPEDLVLRLRLLKG